MTYFLYSTPLYAGKGGSWVPFTELRKLDDHTLLVIRADGLVLSVQPNGDWEWKAIDAPGVPGQYEKATLNGASLLVFNPNAQAGPPYAYPIVGSLV